jgi:hypothetical protein
MKHSSPEERRLLLEELQQAVRGKPLQATRPRCFDLPGRLITCGPAPGPSADAETLEIVVTAGFPPRSDDFPPLRFWIWQAMGDEWQLRPLDPLDGVHRVTFSRAEIRGEFFLDISLARAWVHELVIPRSGATVRLTNAAEGWQWHSGPPAQAIPEGPILVQPNAAMSVVKKLEDQIIDDFYPDMHDMIKGRLATQTMPKLALGHPLRNQLAEMRGGHVFFECGSTIALAVLAARKWWIEHGENYSQFEISTNSSLVQNALYRMQGIEPRLQYGDKWLNQEKYAGNFPIQQKTVRAAMEGDKQSLKLVRDAWREHLITDPWRFDRLFMTASKFHFFCGPFVGSLDNALLKLAYYSCAVRTDILIDGSKLLEDEDLEQEWQKEHCVQVFFPHSEAVRSQWLRHVLCESGERRESLLQQMDRASQRNPHMMIKLPSELITNPRTGETELVDVPDSWGDSLQKVLARPGGEVNVFVVEPEDCSGRDFETRIRRLAARGTKCFSDLRKRVSIDEPRCEVVRLDRRRRQLSDQGDLTLRVWKCTYRGQGEGEQPVDLSESLTRLQ